MRRLFFLFLSIACAIISYSQESFIKTYVYAVNDDNNTVTILSVRPGVVLKGDVHIPGSFTHPESGKRYTVTRLDFNFPSYGTARGPFYGQSEITSIFIPSTIDWICYGAFTGCKKLKEFKVSSDNKDYQVIDGSLYEKDSNGDLTLVRFPPARTSTGFTLPDQAIYIASEAFADNYTITTLRLSKFQHLFDEALKGNLGITTFELNDSYIYTTDGHFLFTDSTHFSHLEGYGTVVIAVAPKYCMDTALAIPSKVQSISSLAGSRASTVTIPSTVTDIFASAFSGCSFQTVTIPSTVKNLSTFYLFHDCRELKTVKIDSKITELRKFTFADCTSLSSVTLPSSCKRLGEGCFAGCKSLTTFTGLYNYPEVAPEGGQFAGSGLTSVNIPTAWETIPERMFMDCSNLETINLNDGVRRICKEAFSGTSVKTFNTSNVNVLESNSIVPLENTLRKIVIPQHEGTMDLEYYAVTTSGNEVDLYIDHKSMGDSMWPYFITTSSLPKLTVYTSKRSFSYFFSTWKKLYVPAGSVSHYRSLTNSDSASQNIYEMFSINAVDPARSTLSVEPNFSWVKITSVTINDLPAVKNQGYEWSVTSSTGTTMNVKIAYTANDVKFTTEYNYSIPTTVDLLTEDTDVATSPRKIIWHESTARPGARYLNLTGQPCIPVEGQLCIEIF